MSPHYLAGRPNHGWEHHLVATDIGPSLKILVLLALRNIDEWDQVPERSKLELELMGPAKTHRQQFMAWLIKQDEKTRELAKKRPLNKIYRLKDGLQSVTRGASPLGLIISYKDVRGMGLVGMQVLGFEGDELGSAKNPLWVPPDTLEDVTEAARKLVLPELYIP
jgi:hypothetical protein